MAPSIHLNGRLLRLSEGKLVSEGGEAKIYNIGNGQVFKLYKQPDHPDFHNDPVQQQLVQEKLSQLQHKLRDFPAGLPDRVVLPTALGLDNQNQVVGYAMPFLDNANLLWSYTQRSFRQTVILNHMIVPILKDLHQTVTQVHHANVVIADFNILNVLIQNSQAYLIDCDSFQWGRYLVRMFTSRYVDPLLCVWDPQIGIPTLNRAHNPLSDWYAFTVMVMETFLLVDPYQGVYRPKDPKQRIPKEMRPLKRVTIFNPEVVYPKPAIPYEVLPDELLDYLVATFTKDLRTEFPLSLLDNLRWTVCTNCGTEHARPICPSCAHVSEASVKQRVTIRGNVTATRIFHTNGLILYATVQGNTLRYLYHDGSLRREDNSIVSNSPLDPTIRYRIQGSRTLLAKKSGDYASLVVTQPGHAPEITVTSLFGNLPVLDANGTHRFWLQSGSIYKDGALGPEHVGDVLMGQTLFWVGEKLGFGFYRANQVTVGFVFNTQLPGINDNVKLPPIKGQLIDSTCVFSGERIWFFTSTQSGGKTLNRCYVIGADGKVIATAEATEGDGSWLSSIRGKCAVADYLLAPTDDGVVRLEVDRDQVVVTKSFPDTEPFVDSGSFLFPSNEGLVVVRSKDVFVLQIH